MRRFTKQQGFSTVEVAVIVVILLALGGVGYWIFTRQSDKNNTNASLSQGESVEVPAAPDLSSASDLDAVDNALNELNLEAGNSDNAALDSQASVF